MTSFSALLSVMEIMEEFPVDDDREKAKLRHTSRSTGERRRCRQDLENASFLHRCRAFSLEAPDQASVSQVKSGLALLSPKSTGLKWEHDASMFFPLFALNLQQAALQSAIAW